MTREITARGKQLVQDRATAQEGLALLQRAAAAGGGEASAQLSVMAAAGVLQPPDWNRALDLLCAAAQQGWAPAQAELRLLARGEGEDYAGLRRTVDLAALLRPRPTKALSAAPRMHWAESFLSRAECAWLIARGRARLRRATVYDPRSGAEIVAAARSNSAADFPVLEADLVFVLINARMAATVGLPSPLFEAPNVLHYAPGESFAPHHDYFDPREASGATELARGGQRIATLLVYLNDAYEGGETDFPVLGKRFKGRTGDALFFANVDPGGRVDPSTRHTGLAPTRGEKWLLSQWVRDRVQGA